MDFGGLFPREGKRRKLNRQKGRGRGRKEGEAAERKGKGNGGTEQQKSAKNGLLLTIMDAKHYLTDLPKTEVR